MWRVTWRSLEERNSILFVSLSYNLVFLMRQGALYVTKRIYVDSAKTQHSKGMSPSENSTVTRTIKKNFYDIF